jgi:hypothetical protein
MREKLALYTNLPEARVQVSDSWSTITKKNPFSFRFGLKIDERNIEKNKKFLLIHQKNEQQMSLMFPQATTMMIH